MVVYNIFSEKWTDMQVRCPVSHDDVIKWKHFPRYWLFVRRIHRSPVTGHRTKASDAELWCFLWFAPELWLSKQSWGWWFETSTRPLLRRRNANLDIQRYQIYIKVRYLWRINTTDNFHTSLCHKCKPLHSVFTLKTEKTPIWNEEIFYLQQQTKTHLNKTHLNKSRPIYTWTESLIENVDPSRVKVHGKRMNRSFQRISLGQWHRNHRTHFYIFFLMIFVIWLTD